MIYNFFIFLGFIFHFPKILYKTFCEKDKHYPFAERMGFKLPKALPKDKKVYWFHANSLGETKAAASFAEYVRLKDPSVYILFSSNTQTGKEIAEKHKWIHQSIYLPLDFSFTMKRLMARIQPKSIFIIETDFWYNFLRFAKKNNAKTFVVSGKISEKSRKRYKMISFLSKKLFSLIDFFCVQNKQMQEAFCDLGVLIKKTAITGNIKFAQKINTYQERELIGFRNLLKIKPDEKVITVASTHGTEEVNILDCLEDHNYKILIAPRHPHRFSKVFTELSKKHPICKLSKPSTIDDQAKIILIDTIGIVPILYQISDLAIVGGSFVDNVGGHNVLEPLMLNTPVIFGPYMEDQKDLQKAAVSTPIAKQVKNYQELKNSVTTYIGKKLEKPLNFANIIKHTYDTLFSLEE